MATLQAQMQLTPKEALTYFLLKRILPSWDFHEVWKEGHARSFTVAKATKSEVLEVIRAEVERAIREGTTFAEFKRVLKPRLQQLGWWGRQEMADPNTGEFRPVQLGSTRRLRTIFQTNVGTAYMAGRYQRFLRNAANRPYWRYMAVLDDRTRPSHSELHGKVWRFDDPIWAILWPPNGWGCRCTIQALSEDEFQRLGQQLEPTGDIHERDVVLNRDGVTVKVKGVSYTDPIDGRRRIFWPDPGWDYNPGAAWPRFDGAPALQPTVMAPVPAAVQPVWKDQGLPDWSAPSLKGVAKAPPLVPQGSGLASLLPDAAARVLSTPVGPVPLRAELLAGALSASPQAEALASWVMPTLSAPAEVWAASDVDGAVRWRWLSLFADASGAVSPKGLVVRQGKDGVLVWAPFDPATDQDALRQGVLLYRAPVSE